MRRYTSDNQSTRVGGSLNYQGIKRLLFGRFDLWGISLDLFQSFALQRSSNNSGVSDFDSTSSTYRLNSKLSNYNKRAELQYESMLSVTKNFSKWSETFNRNITFSARIGQEFKTDQNTSSIDKRNLDRSFQFLRYGGSLSHQYFKTQKFIYYSSLNYSRNFNYASIDQLHTIVDDINAYQIRIGNPGLKNTINHNLNFFAQFNTQSPKSKYGAGANLNGSYSINESPVIDSVINDASGKRIYYYTNAGQSSNVYTNFGFNVSRRIQKSSIQLSYSGNLNQGKNPSYIDGLYTISQNNSLSNRVSLQFSLRSLLVVNVARNMQFNKTKQTAAGLTPFKNTSQGTRGGITLNYPKNFSFSSTLDNVENSGLEKPILLWNTFASYRFLNQQGELKLTAMDLLKQYKNVSNYANQFGTTTSISNGLQQYFLVTFSYFPRKFGKREIKRRDG